MPSMEKGYAQLYIGLAHMHGEAEGPHKTTPPLQKVLLFRLCKRERINYGHRTAFRLIHATFTAWPLALVLM